MAYNSIGGGGTGVSNPQDTHEEYSNVGAFPTTGESGVIYIAIDTNLLYRWTGSSYVEVSPASGISTGGSIPETSVALADGTVTPTNIGLQFVSGTHRAYDLEITVERGSLSQYFMIKGLDTSTGWQQFVEKIGDETGVSFTVHTDGNIRYTSTSTTVIPNIVYKYSTVGVYAP